MAMVIKANSPTDLIKIEKLRQMYKNRQSKKEAKIENNDRFDGISANLKKILRYRTKSVDDLKNIWTRRCHICEELKPARTHHCSVCDCCVIMMDHHCPWVNNCLGMENYRYFILFIFYLCIGSAYYMVTIASIWNHHVYVSIYFLPICLGNSKN
jgi:hypothetical protein